MRRTYRLYTHTPRERGEEPTEPTGKILTAGSFAVVAEVALLWLHGDPRLLPHGVDLRHAEFGVQAEEEASGSNGQVVLSPVPQGLQVLVVDGGEGIHAENRNKE